LAQSAQLLQPRRPLARARRSRRAAAFFRETMARSAKSKGLGYLFLGLLGAALSHELASAFAGAPSPRESAREAAVSMAGGPKDGIFTPMVQGAKVIVGEQQLKESQKTKRPEHNLSVARADLRQFMLIPRCVPPRISAHK